jgi:glycosyltransferase involved in cell wall biosynthesis
MRLFGDANQPEVVLFGGFPFYSSVPFFREMGVPVVYMDCGAVPLEGYSGGNLLIQEKLGRLRKTNLKYCTVISPISEFIALSQTKADAQDRVPIHTIHLAADHIEQGLWQSDKLQQTTGVSRKRSCIDRVSELKREGKKILLNLGRWEPNCYKNSEAVFSLMRDLLDAELRAVMLITDTAEHVSPPAELQAAIHCVGFPDDDELVELMRQSDLGISVSTWEGFNLPLAEMQWINRPVLVLNLAAHPEVVLHPWYLCDDAMEMARKALLILQGQSLDADEQTKAFEKFRSHFTWERVVDDYCRLLSRVTSGAQPEGQLKKSSWILLADVTFSTRDPANPGVIRVARRLGRELQRDHQVVFVVWDEALQCYVLPNSAEYHQLGQYQGPNTPVDPRSYSPKDKRIPIAESVWFSKGMRKPKLLLCLEVLKENYARKIREFARLNQIKLVVVFYDAIPVLRPEFCPDPRVLENHRDYMIGLARCDLIVSISDFSAQCLRSFWAENGVEGTDVVSDILPGEFQELRRFKLLLTMKSKYCVCRRWNLARITCV